MFWSRHYPHCRALRLEPNLPSSLLSILPVTSFAVIFLAARRKAQ